MILFSEKVLISNRCISDLMPNLIKKILDGLYFRSLLSSLLTIAFLIEFQLSMKQSQRSGSGTKNRARTNRERFAHRPLGKSATKKLYPSVNRNPVRRVSLRKSASRGLRKTVVRTQLFFILYFVTKIVLTYCEKKLF
jgi:hypothetical protein